MTKLFPSCMEAARRISEDRDASLGRPTRLGLLVHLAVCSHCRRYARQIRCLQSFLTKYPEQLSRLNLSDHTRSEIIRKLKSLP